VTTADAGRGRRRRTLGRTAAQGPAAGLRWSECRHSSPCRRAAGRRCKRWRRRCRRERCEERGGARESRSLRPQTHDVGGGPYPFRVFLFFPSWAVILFIIILSGRRGLLETASWGSNWPRTLRVNGFQFLFRAQQAGSNWREMWRQSWCHMREDLVG
jgi:hypothetical protein